MIKFIRINFKGDYMSKNKYMLFLLFLLFLLPIYGCSKHTATELDYKEMVNKFINVDINDINKLQENGEEFYLYTGRETCPHCKIFVPKLYEAIKERKVDIYYLDSENTDIDIALKQFRNSYSINTVPDFRLFSGDSIVDILDVNDETQKDEIFDFLDKN